jgi:hypothetical protein
MPFVLGVLDDITLGPYSIMDAEHLHPHMAGALTQRPGGGGGLRASRGVFGGGVAGGLYRIADFEHPRTHIAGAHTPGLGEGTCFLVCGAWC